MRPPKNVFSKNLRFADTKERSKIPTPTRDDDDDDQHPPPFTSSLLPPQEGMNCWMATWEPVNRQQSRYHKSQGAHLDCCRFSPEVVPFEKKWYDLHNSRSTWGARRWCCRWPPTRPIAPSTPPSKRPRRIRRWHWPLGLQWRRWRRRDRKSVV